MCFALMIFAKLEDVVGDSIGPAEFLLLIKGDIVPTVNVLKITKQTIQTEEGIARRSGNGYIYEYNLTDHLGNVRYTFKKNASSFTVEPLQADNYYAFGLRKPFQQIINIFTMARNCKMN